MIYETIDSLWPARVDGRKTSSASLVQQMECFLTAADIVPQAFSHIGVVVHSIEDSLAALTQVIGTRINLTCTQPVEAYRVNVARGNMDGVELEFLQPLGESFFLRALESHGESLQHLSFLVKKIDCCLDKLNKKGVELVNDKPRLGSHGKIAFAIPREFCPVYLELCEPLL